MSTDTKPTRPSFGDVYEQLTWHDEHAIEQAFDADIHDLMQQFSEGATNVRTLVLIVRAFEFISERRAGKKDPVALAAVRNLTTAQVTELLEAYLDHDEEPVPDEPVTDEGKDDSPAE